jgi:eukaryotic-like serine/threonine-protein kinase
MPGEKDVTLRVVAAAFRGRPVSFQLVAPWSKPARDTAAPVTFRSGLRGAVVFSLTVLLVAGAAVWFARRNARLGRGDRRGAARVGTAVCVCMFLTSLLLSHPAAVWNQWFAIPLVLRCGGLAVLAWGLYLAFEPYFRRRYPELLVSWTRLVGGRWADPLVGRDLLGGLLLGSGAVLVVEAIASTPAIFASAGETPIGFDYPTLIGIRGVAGMIANCGIDVLMWSLCSATLLFLGSLLLRKRPLAASLVWAFWFVVKVGRENPILDVPAGALIATLAVLALVRFGLLGIAVFVAAEGLLVNTPITTDFSAWYAGYGACFGLVALALALWGFWSARGGGSLFGAAALDG